MEEVKGTYQVQNFPPKPVLTRTFQPPGKAKRSDKKKEAPYRGYEYPPGSNLWAPGEEPFLGGTESPAAPAPPPPRYVAPPGGPPVDENFRPLPVQ